MAGRNREWFDNEARRRLEDELKALIGREWARALKNVTELLEPVAMVVDALMHSWATDPHVNLPRRYGTRFFSRTNWSEFLDYLNKLDKSRSTELTTALRMVHPPHAKHPDWAAMLKR